MDDSLEDWISDLEIEEEKILNQNHINSFKEQEFLMEILQQPNLSPEREHPSHYPCSTIHNNTNTNFEGNGTLQICNNSKSFFSLEKCASYPSTYLWSFDNSSIESIIHEPSSSHHDFAPIEHPEGKNNVRRSSQTKDHIMAERKRRQELTGSIIALAATIPGLKRTDKAYVLGEAVNYMKKLQQRVKELEYQNKDSKVDSSMHNSNKNTKCYETNSNRGYRSIESLLEVEAKVQEKEVLIGIHCEKQKGVVLKIHILLEKLHLSVASSSVLPCGTSTLKITIVAQMDDEYCLTKDDLVNKIREDLAEAFNMLQ